MLLLGHPISYKDYPKAVAEGEVEGLEEQTSHAKLVKVIVLQRGAHKDESRHSWPPRT